MNLAANGLPRLSELAQPGITQFSAIARLLLQVPATKTTCEHVISTMEILFPKSRLGARDDLMLAQLRIRLDDMWHRAKQTILHLTRSLVRHVV
jgi:hypothetical protein